MNSVKAKATWSLVPGIQYLEIPGGFRFYRVHLRLSADSKLLARNTPRPYRIQSRVGGNGLGIDANVDHRGLAGSHALVERRAELGGLLHDLADAVEGAREGGA